MNVVKMVCFKLKYWCNDKLISVINSVKSTFLDYQAFRENTLSEFESCYPDTKEPENSGSFFIVSCLRVM